DGKSIETNTHGISPGELLEKTRCLIRWRPESCKPTRWRAERAYVALLATSIRIAPRRRATGSNFAQFDARRGGMVRGWGAARSLAGSNWQISFADSDFFRAREAKRLKP